MVTLAVLQPGYLPWLGYFDQMIRADVFLHYDTAQYDKNGWRNRNRILTRSGPAWLTVPVSHRLGQAVREVEIAASPNWARKHCRTLRETYATAPHLDGYADALEEVLRRDWRYLIDLNLAVVDRFVGWLGIDCHTALVSDYDVDGARSEKLIGLCKAVGADRYLTGDAATDYLDLEAFARAGISVEWQRYQHPRYHQCTGSQGDMNFFPFMSTVDLLLNCGAESGPVLRDASTASRIAASAPDR